MLETRERYRALAEEFGKNPLGPHSRDLRALLNRLRGVALKNKHVLVRTKPHKEWMLGVLSGERGGQVRLLPGQKFERAADAEWAVFKLRWKQLTGEDFDNRSSPLVEETSELVELPATGIASALAKPIVGYTDRISVAEGDVVRCMVSCLDPGTYRANVVRLASAKDQSGSTDLAEEAIDLGLADEYPGKLQEIHAGSYAIIERSSNLLNQHLSFTICMMIWPTTPHGARQFLLGDWSATENVGFALTIDRGAVALLLGDHSGSKSFRSSATLDAREWYFVGATINLAEATVSLFQEPVRSPPNVDGSPTSTFGLGDFRFAPSSGPLTIAATLKRDNAGRIHGSHHFNGKIDSPSMAFGVLSRSEMSALIARQAHPSLAKSIIAAWDFSKEIQSDRVIDTSQYGRHGKLINLPARAMTGHNWSGEETNWRHKPDQYGAIHFHNDDVYDAAWGADFEFRIPSGLPSGIYAVRLQIGDQVDRVPFVVRPRQGTASAEVAFLVPTASYMAYANEHASLDSAMQEVLIGHLPGLGAEDLFLNRHREYGSSLYETHSDGSGICYSSRLRPILNMRPDHVTSWVGYGGDCPWQFSADLQIAVWLGEMGFKYDAITDEDLHSEGLGLLKNYRVVVTGTHPEYYSTKMWNAVSEYVGNGGRLMYLGGNGFYWRIAFHPELPGVIEVRRAEDGIRDWEPQAGEYYHSFTGEYGGLWRRLGRPPQMLVGVGMAAQGFDRSSYFRRLPASYAGPASFIFEGVNEEIIGDFGSVGSGAAGLELDRLDAGLGSPPHAVVLASSENLSHLYFPGPEDVNNVTPTLSAEENPAVRGEIVYFETQGGGAVFSVGSISWAGSLSHNQFKNNVSQITLNVLRRLSGIRGN